MLQVKKHTIILLIIIIILVCDLVIFWHFLAPHTSLSESANEGNTLIKNEALTIKAYHKGDNVNSYIQTQMATCLRLAGHDDCYGKVAHELSASFSLSNSLAILAKNESFAPVYARCHEVTHYLGRTEYEKTKDLAGVMATCNSTCQGGCYHGAIEQFFKDNSSLSNSQITSLIPKICESVRSLPGIKYDECQHGLGHAGMLLTANNLPQSLILCDNLDNVTARERCYSGVFMENSSSSTTQITANPYVKKDDPLYPCSILASQYLKLCYQYQSSYFAEITNYNWTKTADLCLKEPKNYQNGCFYIIGSNQVGFTEDPAVMKKDCLLMPDHNSQKNCIEGVISSMTTRFIGDIKKMDSFCRLIQGDLKEDCYREIGRGVSYWQQSSSVTGDFCHQIDPQFERDCRLPVPNPSDGIPEEFVK
ncbi:hypothetical protein BH09PAT1_BH09PAT1_5140 [soil metagenome]